MMKKIMFVFIGICFVFYPFCLHPQSVEPMYEVTVTIIHKNIYLNDVGDLVAKYAEEFGRAENVVIEFRSICMQNDYQINRKGLKR